MNDEKHDPRLPLPLWRAGVGYDGGWAIEFDQQLQEHGVFLIDQTRAPAGNAVTVQLRAASAVDAAERLKGALSAAGILATDISRPVEAA